MLENIFGIKKPIIGMIHLLPLMGYSQFQGLEITLKYALSDLKVLEKGGVDGVLVENTCDEPFNEWASQEVIASMTLIVNEIVGRTKLPVGVITLWNDYRASLSISKLTGSKFVRIPVFVDRVKTSCGIIRGNPSDVLDFRKKINAEEIAIFTDIHVKESTLVEEKNISDSAKKAIENKTDGVILSGSGMGDPPKIQDIKTVKNICRKSNTPIIIGSGVKTNNILDLSREADAIIVGSGIQTKGVLDIEKIKNLVKKAKKVRTH